MMRGPNRRSLIGTVFCLILLSASASKAGGKVAPAPLSKIEDSILPSGQTVDCEQGCLFRKGREALLLQLAVEREELSAVVDQAPTRAKKAQLLSGHCAGGTVNSQCENAFILFKTHRIEKLKKAIIRADHEASELVSSPGSQAVQKTHASTDGKLAPVLPTLPTLEELQAIENLRRPIHPDDRKAMLKSFAEEALSPPRPEDYLVTEVRTLGGKDTKGDTLIVIKKGPDGKPILDGKAYAEAVKRYARIKRTFSDDPAQKLFLTETLPEKAKMMDVSRPHTYVTDGETEKTYLSGRGILLDAAEKVLNPTTAQKSGVQLSGRSPAAPPQGSSPKDPNRAIKDGRKDPQAGNLMIAPGDYLNDVEKSIEKAYDDAGFAPE
jgi:hypothetical protein